MYLCQQGVKKKKHYSQSAQRHLHPRAYVLINLTFDLPSPSEAIDRTSPSVSPNFFSTKTILFG